MTPSTPLPSAFAVAREAHAIRAFTGRTQPKTAFPLVLLAVTVAAISMSVDAVPRYSVDAFFVGLVMTALLSFLVGKLVDLIETSSVRLAVTLLAPTVLGGLVGVTVQTLVLSDARSLGVRDLGGLVDTFHPIPWIASGVVLGGLPALVVTVFLVAASRAVRRVVGHDASEGFAVAYTGVAGVLAGVGLVLVDGIVIAPLVVVTSLAALAVIVALVIDGSRLSFLRRVYAAEDAGYSILPSDRFAHDPSIAPMIANAGAAAVLVKVSASSSYRAAAVEPLALVAESEAATVRPLIRRRVLASGMLVAMVLLGALSAVAHS